MNGKALEGYLYKFKSGNRLNGFDPWTKRWFSIKVDTGNSPLLTYSHTYTHKHTRRPTHTPYTYVIHTDTHTNTYKYRHLNIRTNTRRSSLGSGVAIKPGNHTHTHTHTNTHTHTHTAQANPAIDGYEFSYFKKAESDQPEKSINCLDIDLVRMSAQPPWVWTLRSITTSTGP